MKWIIIFTFLFFIISCGADRLGQIQTLSTSTNSISSSSTNTTVSCLCTSDYSPVCGTDKKDYDNACLAKCIGNNHSYTYGHCQCDNSRVVCGADGRNYGECDAVNNNISVTSYFACGVKNF